MIDVLGTRRYLATLAACLLLATGCTMQPGGQARQTPPPRQGPTARPAPREQQTLELFQLIRATPEVRRAAENLGFQPIAHITKRRFLDPRTGKFDAARYAQHIWEPQRDGQDGLHGWERGGIPPGRTVWVDLDFEEWQPIFEPERFDPQLVDERVNEYLDLIAQTRRLRPQAKICIHGLVREELSGRSGELVEDIVRRCDAVSPAIHMRLTEDADNLNQQLRILTPRLRGSLMLKRKYGIKVFPLIRHRTWIKTGGDVQRDAGGRGVLELTPPDVMREMLDYVLTIEVDGVRVDGLIFAAADTLKTGEDDAHFALPDARSRKDAEDAYLQYLRIIAETANRHQGGE